MCKKEFDYDEDKLTPIYLQITCICGSGTTMIDLAEETSETHGEKIYTNAKCGACGRKITVTFDIESIHFYKTAQKEIDLKEAFLEGFKKSGKGYYDEEIEQAYDNWRGTWK